MSEKAEIPVEFIDMDTGEVVQEALVRLPESANQRRKLAAEFRRIGCYEIEAPLAKDLGLAEILPQYPDPEWLCQSVMNSSDARSSLADRTRRYERQFAPIKFGLVSEMDPEIRAELAEKMGLEKLTAEALRIALVYTSTDWRKAGWQNTLLVVFCSIRRKWRPHD